MPLGAGQLDRRITIERSTVTRNALNEEVRTWAPVATVWASKSDVRDEERWAAHEVAAEVTTRFRVRWQPALADLSPEDRVIYEGREYSINAVKEIGRREGLEITAAARTERTGQ